MIISMRPWGTPGIRSLQSISGTAAVVKGRFHVPSDLQRVLTDKERQYFGSSIYTQFCTGCFAVGFRKWSHLSSFSASIRMFHQRNV